MRQPVKGKPHIRPCFERGMVFFDMRGLDSLDQACGDEWIDASNAWEDKHAIAWDEWLRQHQEAV